MRRFRERLFGASATAGGEEASAQSSEAKYGRYQRSPELEKTHSICRHLEQFQVPQVRIAVRALKDQAKAAELAASAAASLADTVAFIDNNPYEAEAEAELAVEEERRVQDSAINGDQNGTANEDAKKTETATESADDDTDGGNGAADGEDVPLTKDSEDTGGGGGEENTGDTGDNCEEKGDAQAEMETKETVADQEDESVLGEDNKDVAEKATTSKFLEAVEDLVEAYTIEVPRLEKWMQDIKAARVKITAAERLERQALSYRKQLHDSQERRISAKSGREALPPTPADLAADEKLRIQGEEAAEAAKNAIADGEEQLEVLQEGGDIKDAAKVAICRAGRCYAAFAEAAITYAGSKAQAEAVKSQMAALAGLR